MRHHRPDCWTSWTWTVTTKQQSMLFVRTHLVARYMGLMFGFYQQRFGSLRTPLSHKNHLRGSFHRFQQQQHSRPLPLVSLMTMSTSASNKDLETYSIKGPIFAVHLLKCEWVLMTRIANIDGLKVIERFFDLPLDYSKPDGETIRVFARHMIPKDKAKTKEAEDKLPFCKSPCPSADTLAVSLIRRF